MRTAGNRTFMGTVVFLDLGQAARSAAQPELQQRVRDVISRTVGHLPSQDRILLDTGHGAVVCFPGDPEDAVFVAIGIRDSLLQEMTAFPQLETRLGVNLGPVKVVEQGPGETQLLGEGMHGAEAMLDFAAPTQILVSRSFYELVSSLSEEYRELFHHHGTRRLSGARDVDLYELAPVGGARTMNEPTWPAGKTPPAQAGPPPAPPRAQAPAPAPAPPPAAAPSPGPLATPSSGWSPEALADLSTALAKALGPLAPMLVKRTAKQTEDPRALCQQLADSITDEADRTAFEAFARRWVQSARRSSPPTQAAAAPGRVPSRLSPEEKAKLEAALAPHLGPIAKVLVERVAHEAADIKSASQTLANSIPEGESRRTFLKTLTLIQPGAKKPAAPPPRTAPAAPSPAVREPAPAPPAGGTQPLPATPYLPADVLARAEQSLARSLGPMARALVRRSAKSAKSVAELYDTLAEELPAGPERDRFLASRDRA